MKYVNLRNHVLRVAEHFFVQPFEEFVVPEALRLSHTFHKLIDGGWIAPKPESDTNSPAVEYVDDKSEEKTDEEIEDSAPKADDSLSDNTSEIEEVTPAETQSETAEKAEFTPEKGSESVSKSEKPKKAKKTKTT